MTIRQLTDNFSVSGPLVDEDWQYLKQQGVDTLINVRPDNEAANQMPNSFWRDKAMRFGFAYYYLPVTTFEYSLESISTFYSLISDPNRHVHTFCRTGNRAIHLWALTRAIHEDISSVQEVCAAHDCDVSKITEQLTYLREQKPRQGAFI
ncbi:beta-lactamase hydrolase domain-containing protein [Aestuariibacter salexigens]|uniref:beta-lactamase hydrolase domain-containing protein n=1 Tax=Aestuariibacter salexigens TaxID=226010 RepID=UPI0003FE9C67|nr:sulfur transferase domain-containing protein [Aestuariibacter salexigens]